MLKRFLPRACISVFLGTACLISSSSAYSGQLSGHVYHSHPSSDLSHSQQFNDSKNAESRRYPEGKEEVAVVDIHNNPEIGRRGNWDFKQNWRYDRDIFYRGENQTQAYQRNFRVRPTPGIDNPDDLYWPKWYKDAPYYNNPYYYQDEYNPNYATYPSYYHQGYYSPNPINQNAYYKQNPYYIDQNPYYNPNPYYINQNFYNNQSPYYINQNPY